MNKCNCGYECVYEYGKEQEFVEIRGYFTVQGDFLHGDIKEVSLQACPKCGCVYAFAVKYLTYY